MPLILYIYFLGVLQPTEVAVVNSTYSTHSKALKDPSLLSPLSCGLEVSFRFWMLEILCVFSAQQITLRFDVDIETISLQVYSLILSLEHENVDSNFNTISSNSFPKNDIVTLTDSYFHTGYSSTMFFCKPIIKFNKLKF